MEGHAPEFLVCGKLEDQFLRLACGQLDTSDTGGIFFGGSELAIGELGGVGIAVAVCKLNCRSGCIAHTRGNNGYVVSRQFHGGFIVRRILAISDSQNFDFVKVQSNAPRTGH